MNSIRRIVSGGQTGADRAALDVALELGIDHGGWAPHGRYAEDGPLPARYRLRPTESPNPAVRTALNVEEADATLIISHGPLSGGSALTRDVARRRAKPCLHVNLLERDEAGAAAAIAHWLDEVAPWTLNVAGPRASSDPLLYDAVSRILRRVLA